MTSEITAAPLPTEAPVYEVRPDADQDDLAHTTGSLPSLSSIYHALFTKDGWLGDYDYGFLCMPTIPCMNHKLSRQPPFFGLKTKLPVLLALVMGFQHALAMVAGVVTPVLIMSAQINLDASTRSYMLSASLISSGILSLIQITRFRIFNTKYYLGTGLLSVVGTSFNFVPTFSAMTTRMYLTGQCPTGLAPDGLVGTGLTQWAGGAGPCSAMPAEGFFSVCPNLGAPNAAPWASPQWIGLGFLVFMTIMFVEFFGSPFMRNAQVVIGLVVGLIVAAATGYTDASTLDNAPTVTFLWVKNFSTFPLSIYAPAIIPLLVTYVLTMVEAIGDVTASCENNGIIALTRCANASAGYMCCAFLILMGVFSKFGTLFLMIPDAVLGGMTTFLFANVASSGMRILAFLKWTRRDRFIVSAAISLGLGVSLIPNALTHFLSYSGTSTIVAGLVDSVNIILSTGFCVGAIIAIVLNQLLPEEKPEVVEEEIAEGIRQADRRQAAKIAAQMEEAASGNKAELKHL
ncbi:unnamed protein product [Mortierella alpina]